MINDCNMFRSVWGKRAKAEEAQSSGDSGDDATVFHRLIHTHPSIKYRKLQVFKKGG